MPINKTPGAATHRDLATAYLLALAGLPFALRCDADGQVRTQPLPAQPRGVRPAH